MVDSTEKTGQLKECRTQRNTIKQFEAKDIMETSSMSGKTLPKYKNNNSDTELHLKGSRILISSQHFYTQGFKTSSQNPENK